MKFRANGPNKSVRLAMIVTSYNVPISAMLLSLIATAEQ